MSKSIKTEIEAVKSNNAAESALWSIVVVMGLFGAYGMYVLLWDVSKVAYFFTAAIFFAVSIATPMMVMRAEKGTGKWQAFAFVIAGLLALVDWGAGYNSGIQVEAQVMKDKWVIGEEAYNQRVIGATTDLKTAKTNLQEATENRMAIVFPDLSDAGPQTTKAKTEAYKAEVKAADTAVKLTTKARDEAQATFDALPATYQKPRLIDHTFLGFVMAGLQFITLFGFVTVQRITRQRVEAIQSTAEAIEAEVNRKVSARTRSRPARKKGANKKGEQPKTKTLPDGQVIYLTA